MKNDKEFIQSLSRGLTLLTLIAESTSPLSLTELSHKTKLSKSAIQRLTYTLENLELLSRNQETKKFRLGPKMTSMALSVVRNLDLSKIALPYMQATATDTGETVGLAILSGSDVVYINFIKTTNLIVIDRNIGDRIPAYCSSSGKAILAFLLESQLDNILQRTKWKRFTPHTITNKKDLCRELERVRIRGFSTNKEEINLGAIGVAAPVKNALGEVIAAVNIMVPTIRCSMEELETVYARKVMEMADKISFLMGYRRDSSRRNEKKIISLAK
jgi:DNA-binding IclR family transcriptional regulator